MSTSIRSAIVVFAFGVVAGVLGAQDVTTWEPVQRAIKYDYRVMNSTSKPAGKIDVDVPLPLESARQEIHYLHVAERGRQRIFTDVHGQRLAHFRAEEEHPGTNRVDEEDLEAFGKSMRELGQWAEGRYDLLVLTIHWGKNWVRDTQSAHRRMARIAFENGVDLILGHSAHRLQGIEVVDGKAVIYDMGNLLFDCELKPEGQQGGLFRLHLSPEGVHRIEIIPTEVLNGHTILAGHEEAHNTLSEMRDLCSALGTRLIIDEDVEGRAMGVIDIAEPKATGRSPSSLLKSGQIVADEYPARLAGLPAGPCEIYAAVIDTTRIQGRRILGEPRLFGEVDILPEAKK